MLAMVRWMAIAVPLPISIIVITAPTPMTIPSVVSNVRITQDELANDAMAQCVAARLKQLQFAPFGH